MRSLTTPICMKGQKSCEDQKILRNYDHPALRAPLQGGELGKARANKKMWGVNSACCARFHTQNF